MTFMELVYYGDSKPRKLYYLEAIETYLKTLHAGFTTSSVMLLHMHAEAVIM